MYDLISKVATRLLSLPAIDSSLLCDIAELIRDEDYRDHFLEQIALHFLRNSRQSEAEPFIDRVVGLERSRVLCRLAQAAFHSGDLRDARRLFSQAVEATEANRFPTEKSIAVLEVAQALQVCGLNAEAVSVFSKAIDIAAPGQTAEGTAGLEASGVIFSAVKGLTELGEVALATDRAKLISLTSLKEQAAQLLSH